MSEKSGQIEEYGSPESEKIAASKPGYKLSCEDCTHTSGGPDLKDLLDCNNCSLTGPQVADPKTLTEVDPHVTDQKPLTEAAPGDIGKESAGGGSRKPKRKTKKRKTKKRKSRTNKKRYRRTRK